MELPRSTLSARGGAAYMAMMSAIFLGCLVVFYVCGLIYQKGPVTAESIICLVLIIMLGWVPIYMWRMDMEAPVDEPIRFNRARRRIYVYRFRYNGYKPLSREAWGVSAEEYDWDHLRAEFCSLYGPMGTGGLVQFVNLAVVDPSTGNVLDRFIFSQGRQQSEMYWAMAQLFMQQGPDAVPKFDKPPRDWNNETHFENIARRFAPKVKWPETMDVESRSAP
ncbi:DUF6708 domain-containing protein [Pseudomonas sp. HR96]|uniref:DUF6708 domain-containing protein n=1 Tax=Pseudomonas sp. HR96 TaxID=1027966 RepID=UPI002A75200B|nr:DUF6708 domain-containing protein [Pseudomonas sp. HR96]WPO98916.1 DUF6708 domain-containing protein [Pseudomonas sp. HR96]